MRGPSRRFIIITGLLVLVACAVPLVSADDSDPFRANCPGHILAMQEHLDNLAAQGVDISVQQGILSQITSLSQQVQIAAENHDEATVKDLNEQINVLNRQFLETFRNGVREARDAPKSHGL